MSLARNYQTIVNQQGTILKALHLLLHIEAIDVVEEFLISLNRHRERNLIRIRATILDKLIFKIKTGEVEGKSIQNVPAYFYKMMIRFWKMALLIEKERGFMEVAGQSEYARKFPDECPSLIAHYYPDKLTDTKLNQYLAELSKGTTTC